MTPNSTALLRRPADDEAGAEHLLAGALSLLTLYARSPSFDAADAIAHQLGRLARHPAISGTLQATCTALFVDWLGPVELQDEDADRQWRTVHDAPPRAQ